MHPAHLESEIQRAAADLRYALESRKSHGWHETDPGPLAAHRSQTSRERFEQLKNLPDALPNKDALLRWHACLSIERVTWEDRVLAEMARQKPEHRIAELGEQPWSIRALTVELIRTRDASKRTRVAHELAKACGNASAWAIEWAMQRHSAAHHLGIGELGWLEAPVNGCYVSAIVSQVLEATEDAASASIGNDTGWEHAIWTGSATEAEHGWPAVLSPRWFRSVFDGWKVLRGVRIDPGPLCGALCGASFARALARFGVAVHRGCAERACNSFSLAFRPFDMASASYGALFASLLASIPFLKRRLGLGSEAARHQAVSTGRSLLISLRTRAAQAAVASAGTRDATVDAHVTCTSRALRSSVPDETAAVVPRYDPQSPSRLCGALLASVLERELVNRFDDDWFDNPRAHEHLSAIEVGDRVVLDEEGLARGIGAVKEALSNLLLQ